MKCKEPAFCGLFSLIGISTNNAVVGVPANNLLMGGGGIIKGSCCRDVSAHWRGRQREREFI